MTTEMASNVREGLQLGATAPSAKISHKHTNWLQAAVCHCSVRVKHSQMTGQLSSVNQSTGEAQQTHRWLIANRRCGLQGQHLGSTKGGRG